MRVLVQRPLQICLEGRSKSKKCDKQLTHIVRVIVRFVNSPDSKTDLYYNNFSKSVVIFNRSPSVCSIIIPFLSIRKYVGLPLRS